MDAGRFHFLFRGDAGEIDRTTWLRYAGWLAGIVAVLTLPWLWLRGHILHDLGADKLFDAAIFAAYAYALIYAFALVLVGVSYMNLTAKRFRALGWRNALGLASLTPLLAFFSGALRLAPILSPFGAEVAPTWAIWGMAAVFAGAAGWTIWELGMRDEA